MVRHLSRSIPLVVIGIDDSLGNRTIVFIDDLADLTPFSVILGNECESVLIRSATNLTSRMHLDLIPITVESAINNKRVGSTIAATPLGKGSNRAD